MSKRPFRKARHRKVLPTPESLEPRMMLAANIFGPTYEGVFASSSQQDGLTVGVTRGVLPSLHGRRDGLIGIVVRDADTARQVDPGLVRIVPTAFNSASTVLQRPDLEDRAASLTIARVSTGPFSILVAPQRSTRGAYAVSTYLVGDANGDGRVDQTDINAIKKLLGSQSTTNQFPGADANLDGRITQQDLQLARKNLGASLAANVTDPQAFQAPASANSRVHTVFTVVGRAASYRNEFGIFLVDDARGRIGNLQPGTRGYLHDALSAERSHLLFGPDRKVGSTAAVDLKPGQYFGTFLVANGTLKDLRSGARHHSSGPPTKAYLSFARANTDGYPHVLRVSPGVVSLGLEDLWKGGDRDHNDITVRIDFDPSATGPVLKEITLALDPAFDTPPVGDSVTTFTNVDLIGKIGIEPAGSPLDSYLVTLIGADGAKFGTTTTAADGSYHFSNVPLNSGANDFKAVVTDKQGHTLTASLQVLQPGFGADLAASGWTIAERGGAAGKRGSVKSENSLAVLHEGDSFLTSLSRSFVVPASPSSLAFSYANLAFDTTATGFMNDAFEAALVDSSGKPLVSAFAPGRDAFFNVTDGNVVAVGANTTVAGRQIKLDLSGVAAGTVATLVFRLIGNDSDFGSSVSLASASLPSSGAADAAVKFFVVNADSQTAFRYGEEGLGSGNFVDTSLKSPSGVASNPAGSRVWVVDAGSSTVHVYGPTGTSFGSWQATDAVTPVGVTVDNGTLWLVDRSTKTVARYTAGANRTSGAANSDFSFPLDPANAAPSDLVTDGSTVWVTDDALAEVFVYDTAGAVLGRWKLDGDNQAPSGITRNPAGGTDLWVLDRATKKVFQYGNGANLRSGSQTADGTFDLNSSNSSPEGIADPPGPPNLELTAAGLKRGFTLTTFASGFSSQQGIGPLGIEFPDSGGTIISEYPGNIWNFDTTEDGLTVANAIPSTTGGPYIGLAKINGQVYAGDRSNGGRILELNDDGTIKGVLVGNFSDALCGIVPNPIPDHSGHQHLFVAVSTGAVWDVDPVNGTSVIFVDHGFDGISTDGKTLYGADWRSNTIVGFDIASKNKVFESDQIPGKPDGTALGQGVLAGYLYVNTNSAGVWEIDLATREQTQIAGGPNATRGDFIAIAPDGSLLLTQTAEVDRLIPPPGGQFGAFRPEITASAPGSAFSAGSDVLLTGFARSVSESDGLSERIASVTMNGTPVDSLDGQGNFFTSVRIQPGDNTFSFIATTASGLTASTTVTLTGETKSTSSIKMSQFTDLSSGFKAEYSRTSYRQNGRELYADVAVRNVSAYPVGLPLYVGVKNISDPAVKVLDAAGTFADGTPYYDFSGLVTGGGKNLSPDAATGTLSLAFANPHRGRFTYDLVFMGIPNRPPAFTSIPRLEATVNQVYDYPATATDPDQDPLVFSLISGPDGMTVDPTSGKLQWTPSANQVGNFPVTLRVADGRGGSAEQTFTIASAVSRPNRPPVFTSVPVAVAQVGQAYQYDANATDPDSDSLTFALATGAPDGMTIDPATGVIAWSPLVTQMGDVSVGVVVSDGHGGTATQNYTICVRNDANRAPVIVSEPVTSYTLPTAQTAHGASIFLTGHDPDFHVIHGGNAIGAIHITQAAINYITDPAFNPFAKGGLSKFLFVESTISPPSGHIDGKRGLGSAGYAEGTDFDIADAATLNTALSQLGKIYDAIVVASDFGGILTQAELDILNARSRDIINFLNAGGGLYAMAESNGGSNLTPKGGFFQFLPFIVSSTELTQNEAGYTVTDFGAGLGLTKNDINGNASHNIFNGSFGLNVIDQDGQGNIISLAGRGLVSNGGVNPSPYTYLVKAVEAENDPLTYSLVTNPAGMTINPTTGLIAWTPATDLAGQSFPVTVRVDDGRGGSDEQRFTIMVSNDPAPTPPTVPPITGPYTVNAGAAFRLTMPSQNSSGDPLSYALISGPDGLMVDSGLGAVGWSTRRSDVGSHRVVVKATDTAGNVRIYPFNVVVAQPNTAPVFTSTAPGGSASVGLPFEYNATAQDAKHPTGDLRYSLQAPLAGMSVDPVSGRFTWVPAADQIGAHDVTLVVSDGVTSATQVFTLRVDASTTNHVPVLSLAGAATAAWLGLGYGAQAAASDPDGDPLRFELVANPAGMTIDATTGVIRWAPDTVTAAPAAVSVRVTDGRGGSATASLDVSVFATSRNHAPSVVSNPPASALHGSLYAYDLRASDPDGDPVSWQLASAPAGMSLDPSRGTLRWVPADDQVGPQSVTVRAVDPLGLTGEQTFTINVACQNQAPTVVSRPVTGGNVGVTYLYAVRAVDPEGDALQFSVESGPAGLSFQSGTSLLRWTPAAGQAGSSDVVVKVVDAAGNVARQSFTVVISAGAPNRAPVITSRPGLIATQGQEYSYPVKATDPEGDALSFTVTEKPDGMTIDSSGLITWTPTADSLSSRVTVQVTDSHGAITSQSYVLVPRINTAPSIVSLTPGVATVGGTYRGMVRATDPEGDALSFTLVQGPAGMAIDAQGRVSWPASGSPRTESLTVSVTDAGGLSAQRTFELTVAADTTAPRVQLVLSSNRVNLGTPVAIQVLATDNVAVASVQLLVDGTPVALDSQNRATIPASAAGKLTLQAVATDPSGNTGRDAAELRIIDQSLASDVRTSFTRLEEHVAPGQTRSTPVVGDTAVQVGFLTDVYGSVSSTGQPIEYWQLLAARVADVDYLNLDPNSPAWREIGRGTSTVSGGKLGSFDPTLLANDRYVLAVAAYDVTGAGYVMPCLVDVVGNAKLGDFRYEFTDLSLPLNGIPITITRVYDTKESNTSGDFGYGWSLGVRDARIRETVPATQAFEAGKTKVYLNAPDGSRLGFTYQETQTGAVPFGLAVYFSTSFTPDPGNPYTLEIPDNLIRVRGAFGNIIDALGAALGGSFNPTHYRLTTPAGAKYDYDQTTGLKQITDPNGNTVTFTDTAITHSGGQKISLERDGQGRITTIRMPDGTVAMRYRYNAQGDLIEVSQVAQPVPVEKSLVSKISYKTDRAHYLDEYIDSNGKRAMKLDYDPATGRLKGVTDANGNTSTQDFDPTNFTETVRDANGNPTAVTYNERGNVLRSVTPTASGPVEKLYEYNDPASPDKETKVTQNGITTAYTYDAAGNKRSETNPGGTTTWTYTALGKVASEKDALGRVTSYSYDTKGNVTEVVNPQGDRSTYVYDTQGRVTSFKDFNGNITLFTDHCQCGRPETIVNPDTTTRHIETNQFSQVTEVTDEKGNLTRNIYDNAGRLIKVIDAENRTITYEYEGANLTKVTDGLGNSTTYTYFDNGKQKSITDSEGGVTEFTYDKNGNQGSIKDPAGNVTTFDYDEANRLIKETDPLNKVKTYKYDTRGNRIEAIDRLGRKRTFEYDKMNRLTTENWWDGGIVIYSITMTYDAVGNMLTDNSPEALLTFTYDTANRIKTARTEYPGTAMAPVTLTYSYDAMGNVTEIKDNLGVSVSSTYDFRNNLKTRSMSGTGLGDGVGVKIEYDKNGERKDILRFDDAALTRSAGRTDFTYWKNGLIKTIDHTTATGSLISSYGYVYDAVNRLQQETHHGDTYVYDYDKTSQLTSVKRNGSLIESFDFDANGNRQTAAGLTPGSYQIEKGNRYSSDGTYKYTYDAEGNLKTRTRLSDGQVTEYTWDFRNRLTKVEERSAGGIILKTVQYKYDAMNRRIAEVVNGTTTLLTTYDRDNAWADFTAAGAVDKRYLFSEKVDEVLAAWVAGKDFTWYHADKLGTIRDLSNQAGVIGQPIVYSAFGQIQSGLAGKEWNRFTFTGREWQSETGLYYYRARYYDPASGRFISEDPIGFESGEINVIRYVGNKPVVSTDPTGKLEFVEYVAISTLAYGGALLGGGYEIVNPSTCGLQTFYNIATFSLGAIGIVFWPAWIYLIISASAIITGGGSNLCSK